MAGRLHLTTGLLLLVAALFLTPSAWADGGEGAQGLARDSASITAQEAIRIARGDPVARDQAAKNPDLERRARRVKGRWEVGLYSGDEKVGLVIVDAESGEVVESWSGYQVAWKMARGYTGAFGRKLNAPWVFVPLTLIFLVGLIDWRRRRNPVNLDLLALVAFGLSHFFFNRADIGVSVPLVYPVLGYLAARMLWLGLRGGGLGGGLNPVWPTAVMLIVALFLVGFRVGLNIVDSGVVDIGYASVVGADRITDGDEVYGNFPADVSGGDTYGPFTYYTYVPFRLIFGFSGEWDTLPAAHAAAIAFDLGTLALLFLLGTRMRAGPAGRRLGVVFGFAWAAYPYTALALMTNTNDALVALLIVAAFLAASRPVLRGAAAAAAALAKFAPLITLPVLLRLGPPGAKRRLAFVASFVVVAALLAAQTLAGPGLEVFYERTLAYQAGRDSPFSIWGQAPSLKPLRIALIFGVAALALLCLFRPRRLTLPRAAALCAALLIGTQLVAMHWFYLYIAWFYPLVLIALSGERLSLAGAFAPSPRPGAPPRAVAITRSAPGP